MLKINTDAIVMLRDRLLETGGAPSVILSGPEAMKQQGHPLAGDDEAMKLFDATFEAMFLMLSADGRVGDDEREVLKGAIRELTAGVVRTAQIDELSKVCAQQLEAEGAQKRLEAVAGILKKDTMASEAAFVLSAVMAFADSEVADEENDMLNEFADLLGIEGDRANELLDQLEEQQQE